MKMTSQTFQVKKPRTSRNLTSRNTPEIKYASSISNNRELELNFTYQGRTRTLCFLSQPILVLSSKFPSVSHPVSMVLSSHQAYLRFFEEEPFCLISKQVYLCLNSRLSQYTWSRKKSCKSHPRRNFTAADTVDMLIIQPSMTLK